MMVGAADTNDAGCKHSVRGVQQLGPRDGDGYTVYECMGIIPGTIWRPNEARTLLNAVAVLSLDSSLGV